MDDFRKMLIATLPQLRGFAISKTGNRIDADDLLQQTAMKALRAQGQFALGTNFKAWLYRILLNEFLSGIRKKNPLVCMDDISEQIFVTHGNQEEQLLTREVLRAVNRLPATQRDTMLMCCANDMSYEDVARAQNCTVGTVKSRLWRARNTMKEFLLDGDAGTAQQIPSAPPSNGGWTSRSCA